MLDWLSYPMGGYMKTQTIEPAVLAELASSKDPFSVSVEPDDLGWVVYVHDQQGERALLDLEGKAAAVFDELEAVEQRLHALGGRAIRGQGNGKRGRLRRMAAC